MSQLTKIKLLLISCLALTPVYLHTDPVKAEPPVRSVFSNQAQGLGGEITTITVWSGAGTNLNFIPTGETIKKIWLDDPSKIVLDFDSPLCPASAAREQVSNCGDSNAMVVHLRRINPMKFSSLPQTETTLLTVITEGATKDRKLYQFRVQLGKGKPQYSTLSIYPDSRGTPSIELNRSRRARLEDVEKGLRVAVAKKLLGANQGNQAVQTKVNNFLALCRNGVTITDAAQQAGVSMALITRLAEWGWESQQRIYVGSGIKPR